MTSPPPSSPLDSLLLDKPSSTLITAQGLYDYLICQRRWMLAHRLGYAPARDQEAVRRAIRTRLALSSRLMLAGAGLIAFSVLLMAVGLALGQAGP